MKPVVEDKPFEFMNATQPSPSRAVVSEAPRDVAPIDTDVSPIDPVQIVTRYRWLLVIGLLGGLALGHMAFLKLGPEFNAVAQIMVSRRAQVPTRDAIAQAWGERGEHISIIKSPMIVGKAVEKGQLTKLPTMAGSTDPVEDVLDCLEVKRTAGQDSSFINVFELKFRNKQPADARAVLNAIILAYSDYIQESQEEVATELSQQLNKLNSELSQQIEQRQHELVEFRKEAPLLWRTAPGDKRTPGDVTNVHQERVVEIEKDRRLNLIKRAEINGKIRALQNAIDQDKSQEELEHLVRLLMTTAQPGGGQPAAGAAAVLPTGQNQTEQASSQLLPLLLEEQKLLRDYASDHPDVQNVRKSIAKLKQFYEARGVVLPEFSGRNTLGQKVDLVVGYMEFLKQQIEELDHKDEELTRIYDSETKLVKDVVRFMVEDQARSEELDRLKTQWNSLVTNLGQLDMTRDNKGYTMKLLAPVREEWSLKRYLKIVGAATVFVLGVCAGLIFLRELRDTTIKSADDVRRLLHGASILGNVPQFDINQIDVDPDVPLQPSLCYFHRPGSAEAESYRSVRTALFVGLNASQKVIQVSSPEPGDGKSTFISNLAIALAQSGKRVLLVDADLRRPTIHRLFCAREEIGTTEVLAGEIHFANAIQESPVHNLWLLTAGSSPQNPAETLASERFERLLATARSEFDFVLVDSPPLLVVSDPCIVATRTDGLMLVVRNSKNTRAALRHTRQLLHQHGIPLFGVVVNGVTGEEGKKYGYGKEYTDYLKPRQPALSPVSSKSRRQATPV